MAYDLERHGVEILAEHFAGFPTVSSIIINATNASRTIVSNQCKHDTKQGKFIVNLHLVNDISIVFTDCYEPELSLPVKVANLLIRASGFKWYSSLEHSTT